MKKILLVLIAIVGICSLSSCSKTCKCVGKINGEVVYDGTVELSEGDKCSNHNTYVNVLGNSVGVKCSPQLF